MNWNVVWSRRAASDLRRLDPSVAVRVGQAVTRLAEQEQGDVKRLRGRGREWRLRVGDWRVRLTFDEASQTIEVLHVLHRREAYRR